MIFFYHKKLQFQIDKRFINLSQKYIVHMTIQILSINSGLLIMSRDDKFNGKIYH